VREGSSEKGRPKGRPSFGGERQCLNGKEGSPVCFTNERKGTWDEKERK